MMQKVQRWSQPFCTSTNARARSAKPAARCGAVSRTAMMSETRVSAGSRRIPFVPSEVEGRVSEWVRRASTDDEIGALAQRFNSMAAHIQEAHETLEAKVANRTHELACLL